MFRRNLLAPYGSSPSMLFFIVLYTSRFFLFFRFSVSASPPLYLTKRISRVRRATHNFMKKFTRASPYRIFSSFESFHFPGGRIALFQFSALGRPRCSPVGEMGKQAFYDAVVYPSSPLSSVFQKGELDSLLSPRHLRFLTLRTPLKRIFSNPQIFHGAIGMGSESFFLWIALAVFPLPHHVWCMAVFALLFPGPGNVFFSLSFFPSISSTAIFPPSEITPPSRPLLFFPTLPKDSTPWLNSTFFPSWTSPLIIFSFFSFRKDSLWRFCASRLFYESFYPFFFPF